MSGHAGEDTCYANDFDWYRREGYKYGQVAMVARVDEPRRLGDDEQADADQYQHRAVAELQALSKRRFRRRVIADEHLDVNSSSAQVTTTYSYGDDRYTLAFQNPDRDNDGRGGCIWLVVESPRRGSFAYAGTARLVLTRDPAKEDALTTLLDFDVYSDLISSIFRLERARRLSHASATALALGEFEDTLALEGVRVMYEYLGYLVTPRAIWGGLTDRWPLTLKK